jgi:hypothetical protein
MTGIVVEVGPATVRGPNHADAEWISAGIDGVDDELTLIDECPVTVADVWRTVIHDVVGGSADTIALVCPTWWASSRVDRMRDARARWRTTLWCCEGHRRCVTDCLIDRWR